MVSGQSLYSITLILWNEKTKRKFEMNLGLFSSLERVKERHFTQVLPYRSLYIAEKPEIDGQTPSSKRKYSLDSQHWWSETAITKLIPADLNSYTREKNIVTFYNQKPEKFKKSKIRKEN